MTDGEYQTIVRSLVAAVAALQGRGTPAPMWLNDLDDIDSDLWSLIDAIEEDERRITA